VLVVSSSYQWSGYPYDNACAEGTLVSSKYVGTHTAHLVDGDTANITIEQNSTNYKFCNQDFFAMNTFPPLPKYQPEGSEWMTPDQELVVNLLGRTSVAFVTLIGCWSLCLIYACVIRGIFRSTYKPNGKDTKKNFSQVREIAAYVPQFTVEGYLYPVLASNLSQMNTDLVGWEDPSDLSYDVHNLIHDVRLSTEDEFVPSTTALFSLVKHWPPADVREKGASPTNSVREPLLTTGFEEPESI